MRRARATVRRVAQQYRGRLDVHAADPGFAPIGRETLVHAPMLRSLAEALAADEQQIAAARASRRGGSTGQITVATPPEPALRVVNRRRHTQGYVLSFDVTDLSLAGDDRFARPTTRVRHYVSLVGNRLTRDEVSSGDHVDSRVRWLGNFAKNAWGGKRARQRAAEQDPLRIAGPPHAVVVNPDGSGFSPRWWRTTLAALRRLATFDP